MHINRINVLILEDEKITAEDIRQILNNEGYDVLPIAENVEEAEKIFNEHSVDLILVDIKLKFGPSGIDFIKKVRQNHPDLPVVFITANTDEQNKALAFQTNPSAFVGKPFNESNLILSLELAMDRYMRNTEDLSISDNGYMFLKSGKKFVKVSSSEIKYIKAEGSYSRFVTDTEEYLQSGNLRNFEDKLPSDFLRVHKSYIVNYEHVKSIASGKISIGNEEIPIGRSFKDQVKRKNGSY